MTEGQSPQPLSQGALAAVVVPDEPITLHYELTSRDMIDHWTECLLLDPGFKKQWVSIRRSCIGWTAAFTTLVLLSLVLSVLLWRGVLDVYTHSAWLLASIAGTAGVWPVASRYWQAVRSRTKKAMESHTATWAVQYHLGPQSLTIGPKGFSLSTPHHDMTQRWSGIFAVRYSPAVVSMFRHDDTRFVIPRRVFASEAESLAFFNQVRCWHEQSGHGEEGRVRTALATRNVRCPKCGYNLRGAKTQACPECGQYISVAYATGAKETR